MYAYTFQAELNGKFITVPEELRYKQKRATFFVVLDETPEDEMSFEARRPFRPFIPTKGFKFDREEANER